MNGPGNGADEVHAQTLALQSIADSLAKLVAFWTMRPVAIEATFGVPTPTPRPTSSEEIPMATKVKAKFMLKSALPPGKLPVHGVGGVKAVPGSVILLGDSNTITYAGADSNGNPVDISQVATLTPPPTSDTPSVMTVGTPTGMVLPVVSVAVGSVNIDATATWTDGSDGPFSIATPASVAVGPAGSLVATFGTPTVTVAPTP